MMAAQLLNKHCIDGWRVWAKLWKIVVPMSHKIMALVAVVAIACVSYLLLSPMERDSFFLTNYLGRIIFPKLARDQRQRRLSFIAGTVLSTILVAAFVVFLIKYMSRIKAH